MVLIFSALYKNTAKIFFAANYERYRGFIITQLIHARMTASITELKKSPMATVLAGKGEAVAILNRNTPTFYCVPAERYEVMIEQSEDLALNEIAEARANQKRIRVNINEL